MGTTFNSQDKLMIELAGASRALKELHFLRKKNK